MRSERFKVCGRMKVLLPKRLSEASERARKDTNIALMSASYFLVFGAFFTMGNIQTVIIENAKDRDATGYVPGFDGDGFISLSIVYAVSTVFDFLSPSIVAVLGIRVAIMSGGVMYALFDASFFALNEAMLYAASGLLGAGNAVLWIAQVFIFFFWGGGEDVQ